MNMIEAFKQGSRIRRSQWADQAYIEMLPSGALKFYVCGVGCNSENVSIQDFGMYKAEWLADDYEVCKDPVKSKRRRAYFILEEGEQRGFQSRKEAEEYMKSSYKGKNVRVVKFVEKL